MPPLEKLSIKDLENMFSYDQTFTFSEIKDGVVIYRTDSSIPHEVEFHINEFSNLEQTCLISDITAAIDESKYFGVNIKL